MVKLEDLWMREFEDQGPILTEGGTLVRGSDPEIQYENGRWVHFNTFGPTDPALSYSPGIYVTTSPDLLTGWKRPRVIHNPVAHRSELTGRDLHAFETFSTAFVPAAGRWVAMMTAMGPGHQNPVIVPAVASELTGDWKLAWDYTIEPEHNWERKRFGESGICWSDSFGVLCMTYGGRSYPPLEQWATGFMASPDAGQSWIRQPEPFAKPDGYFHETGVINAMSHSTCAEDPRHSYVLHCITTHSGSVGLDQKGLIQWVFFEGAWHRRPGFLAQPALMDMTHIGGPSLLWDGTERRWVLAIHADARERGIRRHTRVLKEKQT